MKRLIMMLLLVILAFPSCALFNQAKDKYGASVKVKAKEAVQKAKESDVAKDLEQKAKEKLGEIKGEEPAPAATETVAEPAAEPQE